MRICLFLTFFFCSIAGAQERATLADLDAVLARAGSVEAFLADRKLQEEYFRLASSYYGGRFSQSGRDKNFWIILDQLKAALPRMPELAERLYSREGLGQGFVLEADIKDRGVEIDGTRFEADWRQFSDAEAARVGRFAKTEADRKRALEANVRRLAQDLESGRRQIQIEADQAQMKASDRKSFEGRKAAELQKKILDSDVMKDVRALIATEMMQKEGFVDTLRSGNADLILDRLEEIRRSSSRLFQIPGIESEMASVHSLIIRSMPAELINPEVPKKVVLNDTQPAKTRYFQARTRQVKVRNEAGEVVRTKLVPAGRSGDLEVQPIPRRFHGIFKGIELGECVVGGQCQYISMERWATPALKDSRHFYIDSGSYQGWVSLYPVEVSGKKAWNVEFGSQILTKAPIFQGEAHPMYERVLKSLESQLPADTRRFVISDSDAINNATVLDRVFESQVYLGGERVSKELRHNDQDLLNRIVGERIQQGQKNLNNYGGRGIIDSNMAKHSNTLLRGDLLLKRQWGQDFWQKVPALIEDQSPRIREFVLRALRSQKVWPDVVWDKVPQLLKGAQAQHVLLALERQADWTPEVWTQVTAMLRSKNSDLRWQASKAVLANPGFEARRAEILPRLFKSPDPSVRTVGAQLLGTGDWSPQVWRLVDGLIKDPDYYVVSAITEAMSKQNRFPEHIWSSLPDLLRRPERHIHDPIGQAIKSMKEWPKAFWDQVPELMAHENAKEAILLALEGQKNWPPEVWDRMHLLMTDPEFHVQHRAITALKAQTKIDPEFVRRLAQMRPLSPPVLDFLKDRLIASGAVEQQQMRASVLKALPLGCKSPGFIGDMLN